MIKEATGLPQNIMFLATMNTDIIQGYADLLSIANNNKMTHYLKLMPQPGIKHENYIEIICWKE